MAAAASPARRGRAGSRKVNLDELAVIVIETKTTTKDLLFLRSVLITKLRKAGLKTESFFSKDKTKVFTKVFATHERLLIEADRDNHELLLDKVELRRADIAKNLELQERGMIFSKTGDKVGPSSLAIPFGLDGQDVKTIPENQDKVPYHRRILDPYEFIYSKFDTPREGEEHIWQLYARNKTTGQLLSHTTALKLLHMIITAPSDPTSGGAGLKLDDLVEDGKIVQWFCMHQPPERKRLTKAWLRWDTAPWNQPINHIREVFGEEIAMYHGFLAWYATALFPLALLGIAVFVHSAYVQAGGQTPGDVTWLPVFGFAVALWATFFTEIWKRKQSHMAMEWGTSDFSKTEALRPEYKSSHKVQHDRSSIHGGLDYFDSPFKRRWRFCCSTSTISFAIGTVIVVVFSVFFIQIFFQNLEETDGLPSGSGSHLSSVLTAIQINVMSFVYKWLAVKLNDYELHRTQTQYENALIVKVATFEAINSYFTLAWIGFFKGHVTMLGKNPQCDPDCLTELQDSLGIIFITRLLLGNFTELVVPRILILFRSRGAPKDDDTPPEDRVRRLADPSAKTEPADLAAADAIVVRGILGLPDPTTDAMPGSGDDKPGAAVAADAVAIDVAGGEGVELAAQSRPSPKKAAAVLGISDRSLGKALSGRSDSTDSEPDPAELMDATPHPGALQRKKKPSCVHRWCVPPVQPGVSAIEAAAALDHYDDFDDFSELLISYGYIIIFGTAFPLSVLLVLINNFVEIRVDAAKLLFNSQRPLPRGAQGIGAWFGMVRAFGTVGVISNLAIILFTDSTSFFGIESDLGKLTAFVLAEHVIFVLKALIDVYIVDVPYNVQLQLMRQQYLVDKHIRGVEDDIIDDDSDSDSDDDYQDEGEMELAFEGEETWDEGAERKAMRRTRSMKARQAARGGGVDVDASGDPQDASKRNKKLAGTPAAKHVSPAVARRLRRQFPIATSVREAKQLRQLRHRRVEHAERMEEAAEAEEGVEAGSAGSGEAEAPAGAQAAAANAPPAPPVVG